MILVAAEVMREFGHEEDVRVEGRASSRKQSANEQREQLGGPTVEPSLPGLMSSIYKNPLLPVLSTWEAIDKTRSDEPPSLEGDGGVRRSFAMMLAPMEDSDNATREQRPRDEPPNLPHCQASDRQIQRCYAEALRSDTAHL